MLKRVAAAALVALSIGVVAAPSASAAGGTYQNGGLAHNGQANTQSGFLLRKYNTVEIHPALGVMALKFFYHNGSPSPYIAEGLVSYAVSITNPHLSTHNVAACQNRSGGYIGTVRCWWSYP